VRYPTKIALVLVVASALPVAASGIVTAGLSGRALDAEMSRLQGVLGVQTGAALLHVVDYAPFVFDFTFKRFTHMTPAEQDASLEGWMRSRFALRRQAFMALRNLSFLGYYSQEETWPLIGYAGPLLRPKPDPT
jgi:hypothetical protein